MKSVSALDYREWLLDRNPINWAIKEKSACVGADNGRASNIGGSGVGGGKRKEDVHNPFLSPVPFPFLFLSEASYLPLFLTLSSPSHPVKGILGSETTLPATSWACGNSCLLLLRKGRGHAVFWPWLNFSIVIYSAWNYSLDIIMTT